MDRPLTAADRDSDRDTDRDTGPDTVPDGLAEALHAPAPALVAAPAPIPVPPPVAAPAPAPAPAPAALVAPEAATAEASTPESAPAEDFAETVIGPIGEPDDIAAIEALTFAPMPPPAPSAPLAVVELLDRDGQVRQSVAVAAWPLRIGRALDNDLVLNDPHVAPAHLSLARGEHALLLEIGSTRNGVQHGRNRLRAGESATLPFGDEPLELVLGRTRLRVRLPDQPLAPELPLASAAPLLQRLRSTLIAAALLVLGLVFGTYLDTDPDGFGRTVGSMLLTSVVGAAIWCGAWALLSKTFTRQAHFGWHLRVFLLASIAMLVVGALPALIAFSLSWGWITDFAFVGMFVVGATALYFHLLAVEPARHRLLRWVAVAGAVSGIGLTLWFNQQRSDQFGDELYMNHLFPPALRLARPVPTDRFIDGLTSLKATLDKKAKDTSTGDDTAGRGDDE